MSAFARFSGALWENPRMPISVACACGHQFRAKDEFVGKRVKCPKCGQGVVIAGPAVPACDVFLSYSSKDKAVADAACAALEARGIRCWVAPRDILPGKEWGAAIIDGIEQSRSMVLVFSANANNSQQVMREVERAVHRGMPIIPFRIEDVPASRNMEYFISCHHWMDAFDGSLEEHLDQLAKTVRTLLAGQAAGGQAKAAGSVSPAKAASRTSESSSPRRAMSPVLFLLLALVIVGGAAGGFYIWSKLTPPASDKSTSSATNSTKGQEQTYQQQATQSTTPSSKKGDNPSKVKPTDKDESSEKTVANNSTQRPADDGKQNPPMKESPKTVALAPAAAYSEDLRMVDVGDRPKQWKCDNSIALMKGQDGRPYLHASKEG